MSDIVQTEGEPGEQVRDNETYRSKTPRLHAGRNHCIQHNPRKPERGFRPIIPPVCYIHYFIQSLFGRDCRKGHNL